jgi:hypothetical protein
MDGLWSAYVFSLTVIIGFTFTRPTIQENQRHSVSVTKYIFWHRSTHICGHSQSPSMEMETAVAARFIQADMDNAEALNSKTRLYIHEEILQVNNFNAFPD